MSVKQRSQSACPDRFKEHQFRHRFPVQERFGDQFWDILQRRETTVGLKSYVHPWILPFWKIGNALFWKAFGLEWSLRSKISRKAGPAAK